MPIEIKLPQWGMNMNDGTVIKWLKTVGDKITKDEPLVEIESTKVSSAVEAIEDGILGRINVEEGVLVPVGAVLGLILLEGEKIEDFPETIPETIIEQKVEDESETQTNKQERLVVMNYLDYHKQINKLAQKKYWLHLEQEI